MRHTLFTFIGSCTLYYSIINHSHKNESLYSIYKNSGYLEVLKLIVSRSLKLLFWPARSPVVCAPNFSKNLWVVTLIRAVSIRLPVIFHLQKMAKNCCWWTSLHVIYAFIYFTKIKVVTIERYCHLQKNLLLLLFMFKLPNAL